MIQVSCIISEIPSYCEPSTPIAKKSGPRAMTLTSQSHERAETNSARVSPSRITVARLRRGLTKAELAAHLNIAPATLSRWENEGPPPSHTESILERLETTLGFSAGYFLSPELEVPSMDSTLFRAGSRATLRQKSVAATSTFRTPTSRTCLGSRLRRQPATHAQSGSSAISQSQTRSSSRSRSASPSWACRPQPPP